MWGRSEPKFPSEFGGLDLSLCLDLSTRIRLCFGWPAVGKDCSLDPPWSYAVTRDNGAKTGLV